MAGHLPPVRSVSAGHIHRGRCPRGVDSLLRKPRRTETAVKTAFFLILAGLSLSSGGAQESESPYLIPQTVFVGDKARLIIPLGSAFSEAQPVVLTKPEELPPPGELVIHRIELERRAPSGSSAGVSRLLIDFTAFAPGLLVLPALEIPSGGSILRFSKGLTISIASILTGDALVLGPPAPPAAVPGTALLVYGAIGLLFVLILLGFGACFWGRAGLAAKLAGFRRRRLLRGMRKTLQNLRKELAEPTPEGVRESEALSEASVGFRTVLTVFTGVYCHGLAAGEFVGLSVGSGPLSGGCLCGLFRRCDILRFSGARIPHQELLSILEEMERCIDALRESA